MQRLYVCPTDGLIHPPSCITGTWGYGSSFIGPIFSPGTDGENTNWSGVSGQRLGRAEGMRQRLVSGQAS